MKTLIKYLVTALVVIMVSCDDTEQLIYKQPNSFTLTLNQEDELQVDIQTGEKIGINGRNTPYCRMHALVCTMFLLPINI
jgi:hypothetical protein